MKFKKYPSISNIGKIINKIKENISANTLFVATEKIDGTNLSFIISNNGEDIKIAKRSGTIQDNEVFYDSLSMLEKYNENIKCVYNKMIDIYGDLEQVQIYGEHFGGFYDRRTEKGYNKIQKRVSYIPFTDFIVFDIGFIKRGNNYIEYVDWETLKYISVNCGFNVVPELGIGTLDKMLNIYNKFNTLIPGIYGLEEIGDNIAEGVVIKTLDDIRIGRNFDRVIIKNKNEKFSEKRRIKKFDNSKVELTNEQIKYIKELSKFLEKNRIVAVVSKGIVNIKELKNGSAKEIGKLKGLFIKDALEDFIKDNPEYNFLEKEDKKIIQKKIQSFTGKTINEWINSDL